MNRATAIFVLALFAVVAFVILRSTPKQGEIAVGVVAASPAEIATGPTTAIESTELVRESAEATATKSALDASRSVRTITGSVRETTGRPLPNVRISLAVEPQGSLELSRFMESPFQATSGPDGRFALKEHAIEGVFELRYECEGYASLEVEQNDAWAVDTYEVPVAHLEMESVVSGRIVDDTGALGIGFVVEDRDSGARAVTDAAGRFAIRGLGAGIAQIVIADRDGFVDRLDSSRLLTLGPGESIDLGDLVLERAVVVSGRLLDLEGRGISGGTIVSFVDSEATNSIRTESHTFTCGHATSGATGEFSIAVARGEPFDLEATADGFVASRFFDEDGVSPFSIALHPMVELRVRARDAATGTTIPITRMWSRAIGEDGHPDSGRHVSLDRNQIRFDPGSGISRVYWLTPFTESATRLRVTIASDGYEPTVVIVDRAGLESATPPPFEVSMIRGGSLSGRVFDARTDAPAGRNVSLWLASRPDERTRHAASSETDEIRSTHCDDAGRFHFDSILPGRYQLSATSTQHASKTMILEFPLARDAPPIVFRLERAAGIRGSIVGSKGVCPLTVLARSADHSVWETRSDAAGTFTFTDLVPGEYQLGLLQPMMRYSLADDALFERAALDPPVLVQVVANESTAVVVDANSSQLARVKGHVRASGSPRDGFVVVVESSELIGAHPTWHVGPDGSFDCGLLLPGDYTVCVERRGTEEAIARKAIRVVSRSLSILDFDLKLTTISGRVTDSLTGAPVCDATVFLTGADLDVPDSDDGKNVMSAIESTRRVDRDGGFRFDAVESGSWTIDVEPDGIATCLPASVEVTVRADSPSEVSIALSPAGAIMITLEGPAAGPTSTAGDSIFIRITNELGEEEYARAVYQSEIEAYLLARVAPGKVKLRYAEAGSDPLFVFEGEAVVVAHATTTAPLLRVR